jgi:hypothetical protein
MNKKEGAYEQTMLLFTELRPFCPKTTGAYTELIGIGPELVQKPLAKST